VKKFIISWVLIFLILGSIYSQKDQLRPMTIDDSLNMLRLDDVQMSPDGKLVFFSKSELDWGINKRIKKYFMIPVNGGEARPYIGEAGGSGFQFSPDGKYISFKRSAEKTQQIFIISLKGGEAIQLTDHINGVDSYKWSPDASRIFFTAEEPMGEEEKREYDLGDDAIFIFEGPNGREEKSWKNLWVFDLSTGDETKLTNEELIINEFDISPDGKHVVFVATEQDDDNYVQIAIKDFSLKLVEFVESDPSVLDQLEWRDVERMIAKIDDEIQVFKVSECREFRAGTNTVFVDFNRAINGIKITGGKTESSNVLVCKD